MIDEIDAVNVIIAFRDQDGAEWLAAAIMAPLTRSGGEETVPVEDLPGRLFTLAGFRVVTDTARSRARGFRSAADSGGVSE